MGLADGLLLSHGQSHHSQFVPGVVFSEHVTHWGEAGLSYFFEGCFYSDSAVLGRHQVVKVYLLGGGILIATGRWAWLRWMEPRADAAALWSRSIVSGRVNLTCA